MPYRAPSPALFDHAIPRALHQIWWAWQSDGVLCDEQQPHVPGAAYWGAWRDLHPHYEHAMWRSAASFDFVKQNFPDVVDMFMAYPRHIQRCDVFRCMLLAKMGGLYSDIDVIPYINMDKLLARYPHGRAFFATECVASVQTCEEMAKHPIRDGMPEHPVRVANYWMATCAGHPIYDDIFAEMQARAHLKVTCDYDVFYTTGPDVITTVVHKQMHKYPDVVLLSAQESWVNFKHVITHSWREDADAIKQPLI